MAADSQNVPAGEEREALIGQLVDEYLRRRSSGQPVDESELLGRHPELAEDLRAHFHVLRGLRPTRDPLDELLARGIVTHSPDPRYPAEFGPYQVLGFVGRGGMGVVLKALDPGLRRTVALKILRPDIADDSGALARFEREARAAAGLRHPNIVTVHAVGEVTGVRYIAMEYVDGPSLAEVIREAVSHQPSAVSQTDVAAGAACPNPLHEEGAAHRPTLPPAKDRGHAVAAGLPADLIRRIFRELLLALDAAHRAGLIHRDVKAANILLQSDEAAERPSDEGDSGPTALAPASLRRSVASSLPLVKLADFGLARMRSSQTQLTTDGSVLGTPEYMSPEQARGDPNIDHRTDLYSAGVVLYEMLTGRTPFKADSATATIHRILHDDPADPRKLNKSVDPVLASLALRLMAKRPEERLGTAGEALNVLEQGRRLAHGARARQRRIATAVLVVVGAAALIGIGALWRDRAPPTAASASKAPAIVPPRGRTIVRAYLAPNAPHNVVVDWSDGTLNRMFGQVARDVHELIDLPFMFHSDDQRCCVFVGQVAPDDGVNLLSLGEPEVPGQNNVIWSLWLGDQERWPDCPQHERWYVDSIVCDKLEVDGLSRLIVIAKEEGSYATCLSIVDTDGHILPGQFWHMGHLSKPVIINGLLGSPDAPRPGIVVVGMNNKLDGFETRELGDERHYTDYEVVPVIMVLDPLHLDGMGPPRCTRFAKPTARLVAYAFLDGENMAPTSQTHGGTEVRPAWEGSTVAFEEVSLAYEQLQSISLKIRLSEPGGTLYVTPELDLCPDEPGTGQTCYSPTPAAFEQGRDAAFFRERWYVIIRGGEYQPNEHHCPEQM